MEVQQEQEHEEEGVRVRDGKGEQRGSCVMSLSAQPCVLTPDFNPTEEFYWPKRKLSNIQRLS